MSNWSPAEQGTSKQTSVDEALLNARVKTAAYKATQTTLQRRQRDKAQCQAVYDTAVKAYDQAYKDAEAAREEVSAAKHQLFEAIEREAF